MSNPFTAACLSAVSVEPAFVFLGSPLNECPGNGIISLMDSGSLPVQMTVCEHMRIREMCLVLAHLEAIVPLLNRDLSAL